MNAEAPIEAGGAPHAVNATWVFRQLYIGAPIELAIRAPHEIIIPVTREQAIQVIHDLSGALRGHLIISSEAKS